MIILLVSSTPPKRVAIMDKKITGLSVFSYLAKAFAITAVYYVAGKWGLSLAFANASATAIWPPTGIALAVILLLGYRFWPSIFWGAFLVNITTQGSAWASFGIATGNTLEALLSVFLVNRYSNGRETFNHPINVLKFSVLVGLISTTVSATAGVASLALGGFAPWANFGPIWLMWWLGDTSGGFILAPMLILWGSTTSVPWDRGKCLEAALLLLSLFAVGQVIFSGKNYPLAFTGFPILMWSAFRFGQRETATVVFILSVMAMIGTLHSREPFGLQPIDPALLFLQMFMVGLSAITALVVGAAVQERRRAESDLRKFKERLQIEKDKFEQVLNIEEGLNTILDANKLVDFIVNKTTEVLEAEKCSLLLLDDNKQELCVRGRKGTYNDAVGQHRIKMGQPIAGLVAQEGEPVLVKNIEEDSRFARPVGASYKTRSFMCAPIKINYTLKGVMCVADKKSGDAQASFSDLDFKVFCMIVRQVAVALENAQLYRELNYLAVTDPLTELNNFRYFTQCLDHEIHRAVRYANALCLLMVDVDNFKLVNDHYGYLEGDILLKKVGQVLKRMTRKVDIVCRYAGDEFAIILPETEITKARNVAEKKKRNFIENSSSQEKITVSVGLAQYHGNMNRHDFILKADMALLEAKKQGKNRLYSLV